MHRTNCRVKPLKSHKSKQGVNMFFADGNLYYADAPVKKVIKYSVDDQDILATLYTKKRSAFIIPIYKKSRLPTELTIQNSVLICDGLQIKVVDLDSKAELDVSLSDDTGLEGHVGSSATHNTGQLFFSVIQTGISHIRLTFVKDCSRLFGIDMTKNRIVYFNMDQLLISSPISYLNWGDSPLVENSQARGLTIDSSDHLWMCCSGEGKVIQVDLETKAIIKEISTPRARQLSSLCFGGNDYRELFVASSYAGLAQDELTRQINAGHIFSAKGYSNVRGRKPTPVYLDLPSGSVMTPNE
ncbi:regucalcin-like [Tropilaelaps mercedesae]|uniref:Regucalcin-like n=1 Tax=Tropilaelaps mercedesae TaxID=418985 RepID=A0A1V9Y1J7_9ACAR|nr:regucalcin-like [Tropilaelaps mercedesae]